MSKEIYHGKLNAYDPLRGVGWIRRAQGKDVFVHYSNFVSDDKDSGAFLGSIVEFELEEPQRAKGPRALNVRIIG